MDPWDLGTPPRGGTKEYTLDQVAEAYEDVHAGKSIRGVIVLD